MSDSNYTVLRNAHISPAALFSHPDFGPQQVLGAIRFANPPNSRLGDLPALQVSLPHIAGEYTDEVWAGTVARDTAQASGIAFRCNQDWLFGTLEVTEDTAQSMSLRQATASAYQRLFGLMAEQGYPHVYRCWNYMPRINEITDGLERYRQFNLGRQDAFLAWGRDVTGNLPAACALGTVEGPLQVAFLAGRAPSQAIENPRQVSAYAYPEEYGPRSPTFCRASLLPLADQDILLISGTASIVGHKTMHVGDVVAQTRETLVNLETVVHQANQAIKDRRFDPAKMLYRVYVRHPEDWAAIRDELMRLTGDVPQALFVQADICREDLLLEIEATAFSAPRAPMDGQ